MPYAVISDVHSNLEALLSVLGDIGKRAPSAKIIFTGDAVGYGPDPNDCVRLIDAKAGIFIAGNHDRGAIGLTDAAHFNEYARLAILWTKEVLTDENADILRNFPLTKSIGDIFLVHSTPWRPEEWSYILTAHDASVNFHFFSERICLIGHSHRPLVLEREPSGDIRTTMDGAEFKDGRRYIVNAGSVGQPRDGDPRACYALMDEKGVEFIRVEYPLEITQEKMRLAGLPTPLIDRLSAGR